MGLTLLAHLLAFLATERMARHLGQESWSLAGFNLLLFTLFLVAVLAMGRLYYSRSYLLVATLLAFLLLLLYLRVLPPLRLALLPGEWPMGSFGSWAKSFSLEGPRRGGRGGGRPAPPGPQGPSPAGRGRLPRPAHPPRRQGVRGLHGAGTPGGGRGGFLPWRSGDRALPPLQAGLGGGACALFSPLALLVGLFVALLVYLDLGRPVLFAQERVGSGEWAFKAYMFRTMRGLPGGGLCGSGNQPCSTPFR